MLFACCRGLFFIFYMGLWWILFSNHHLKIITPEFISDYSKVVALSTPHPKWYFLFSGNSNTYYCTTGQSISSNYLGWWLLCFEIISWRCGEINSWWFGTTTTPIWINLLFWGGGGLTTSKTVVIIIMYCIQALTIDESISGHGVCLVRWVSAQATEESNFSRVENHPSPSWTLRVGQMSCSELEVLPLQN